MMRPSEGLKQRMCCNPQCNMAHVLLGLVFEEWKVILLF